MADPAENDVAGDDNNHPLPDQQLPLLRSINSLERSYVRFMNATQRNVDVLWINYQGDKVKYKTLLPWELYKINTFVTHPWVFQDSERSTALVVNSEEVFFPQPEQRDEAGQALVSPHRLTYYITIPLYTLRDRAAQVVCSCLRDPKEAYNLDIPRDLLDVLEKWAV